MSGWRASGRMDRRTGSPAEQSRAPGAATTPARGCRLEAEGREREDALGGAYLGALAQQRLDESPADALSPAGDQSHLPIDVHGRRAPAARSAPAEPQKPSAVSSARFTSSMLRSLPLRPPSFPPPPAAAAPAAPSPPAAHSCDPEPPGAAWAGGSRGGAGH